MSDLLESLKRLDAEATDAPWTALEPDEFGDIAINEPGGGLAVAAVCNGEMRRLAGFGNEHQANAKLIENVRNALPEIIAALEENERLKSDLAKRKAMYHGVVETLAREQAERR